jgi:hypothetical protein
MGETTTVLALNDTIDLMNKQTNYSHPLVQWPLPGCITHQRKRMVGSNVANRTFTTGSVVPSVSIIGTNRLTPYFYSTCLVGIDLDAFEGVSSKIRSV